MLDLWLRIDGQILTMNTDDSSSTALLLGLEAGEPARREVGGRATSEAGERETCEARERAKRRRPHRSTSIESAFDTDDVRRFGLNDEPMKGRTRDHMLAGQRKSGVTQMLGCAWIWFVTKMLLWRYSLLKISDKPSRSNKCLLRFFSPHLKCDRKQ